MDEKKGKLQEKTGNRKLVTGNFLHNIININQRQHHSEY